MQGTRTKAEKAIVDRLEAHLRPNVAHLNARQGRVVRGIADLHKERVRTIVLAVQEETRHQNHVVGSLAQAPICHGPRREAPRRQRHDKGARCVRAHTYPGHHLSEVTVGLWMINSHDALSYVAVVSRPRRKVPWPAAPHQYSPPPPLGRALRSPRRHAPSSVCAYVPRISCDMACVRSPVDQQRVSDQSPHAVAAQPPRTLESHSSFWASDAWPLIVGRNMP
jgi:hypothetical protein